MYDLPSPLELREFLKFNNLTGSKAAELIGVDSRTIRKWTAEGGTNARGMPWAAWALLRIMVGAVSVEQLKEDIKKPQETPGATS